jgi:hypothetical protein
VLLVGLYSRRGGGGVDAITSDGQIHVAHTWSSRTAGCTTLPRIHTQSGRYGGRVRLGVGTVSAAYSYISGNFPNRAWSPTNGRIVSSKPFANTPPDVHSHGIRSGWHATSRSSDVPQRTRLRRGPSPSFLRLPISASCFWGAVHSLASWASRPSSCFSCFRTSVSSN